MRRLWSFLALCAVLLLAVRPGRADTPEVQIHLLVMGPGEHLYTRGGHAALMVLDLEGGVPVRRTVYNFGDTDWDDPFLVPRFLRGDLTFFLSDTGELLPTLQEYGVRQSRTISSQRLNLSPAQAAEVARRLREGIAPGKREYTFHHMRALCSTRIMDLLDDVLGGRLRAELAHAPGPYTGRYYQELVFGGSPLASIGGDLFLGRLHDRVLDRYESAAYPENMRDYLRTILVVSPSNPDRMVPLADPPIPLVERTEPLIITRSWFTRFLWGALIALLLAFGARARWRAPTAPAHAARVAFWAALWSGIAGALILGLIVLSRVPELRHNELILLFWPTDLWLAWRMRSFLKNRSLPDAWPRSYVSARLAVAALVVLGHASGLLHQEPRILAALGVFEAAVVYALIKALYSRAATREAAARLASPKMTAEA